MRRLFWFALCAGVAALAVGSICTTRRPAPPRPDPPAPGLGDEIRQEQARARALEAREERLRGRLRAKQQVARDLIAHRVTLAEAVARFRALHAAARDSPYRARPVPPHEPEERELREEVLSYVAYELRGQPDRAAGSIP